MENIAVLDEPRIKSPVDYNDEPVEEPGLYDLALAQEDWTNKTVMLHPGNRTVINGDDYLFLDGETIKVITDPEGFNYVHIEGVLFYVDYSYLTLEN
jgi:hypothetical protein